MHLSIFQTLILTNQNSVFNYLGQNPNFYPVDLRFYLWFNNGRLKLKIVNHECEEKGLVVWCHIPTNKNQSCILNLFNVITKSSHPMPH
jgi:hypothetical protein